MEMGSEWRLVSPRRGKHDQKVSRCFRDLDERIERYINTVVHRDSAVSPESYGPNNSKIVHFPGLFW